MQTREEFNRVIEKLEADGYKDVVREFSQFYLKDVFEKLLLTVHTNTTRAAIIMPPAAEKVTVYIRDFEKDTGYTYTADDKVEWSARE